MPKHQLSLLLLLFLIQLFASSLSRKEPFGLRISCGARHNIQTLPTNTIWYKDFAYTGGIPTNATPTSYITPPLKTLRYFPASSGPEHCYTFNRIPKGHFNVRVFFGIVKGGVSGVNANENEPLFDVSIQGTLVYELKTGWTSVDEEAFTESLVFVNNGGVEICFHSTGHGDPSVLSIEVLQVDDKGYYFGSGYGEGVILRTEQRLSCGRGKPAFDADLSGDRWGGDRFWAETKTFGEDSDKAISTEEKIKGAGIVPNFYPEELYKTAIVSSDMKPDLAYVLEVYPNRNYSVWLHFAEIDARVKAKGERVFDILINGDVAFDNVDIIGLSGDRYAAVVLNKTVSLSGKSLTITLHPTKGNHAIINAIEVFEIIPAEARTSSEEVKALQAIKNSLALPYRFGWNGDPCVPQQHPWSGVDCQFDTSSGKYVIDGLGLDNQGLRGFMPNDISKLHYLQNINLSGNSIRGSIPSSLGTITSLETLDLSFNELNGSIPESLGQLPYLRRLNLNSNFLSGKVPATLGGRLLHRASFNFTANAGLCGIPGLRKCGPQLPVSAKIGIALGALVALLLIVTCLTCWWKRRQNILRTQRIAARDAPYAKARTHYVRDVQMARHNGYENSRTAAENGPSLLT